jgi:hypothetical protein
MLYYQLVKRIIIAIILVLAFLSVYCRSEPLDRRFVRAIHQIESNGRYGPIKGDNGKALGPFQIHQGYWQDARMSYGKYGDCQSYSYALDVMTAYLNRYGLRFIRNQDYQSLARIHNGGPSGPSKPATWAYWMKVKRELDKR